MTTVLAPHAHEPLYFATTPPFQLPLTLPVLEPHAHVPPTYPAQPGQPSFFAEHRVDHLTRMERQVSRPYTPPLPSPTQYDMPDAVSASDKGGATMALLAYDDKINAALRDGRREAMVDFVQAVFDEDAVMRLTLIDKGGNCVSKDLSPRRIAKYYETLSEAGVIKITTSYRPHHIIEADDGTQSKAIYHVGQLTTYGHGEQVQMTGTLSFEATKCHNDGRWRFARMDWRFDQVVQVVLTERIAVVEVEAADQWSAWYRSYLEQALSSEEKLVRKMAKWEEGRTAASMVRIEESQIFPETVMDYMQQTHNAGAAHSAPLPSLWHGHGGVHINEQPRLNSPVEAGYFAPISEPKPASPVAHCSSDMIPIDDEKENLVPPTLSLHLHLALHPDGRRNPLTDTVPEMVRSHTRDTVLSASGPVTPILPSSPLHFDARSSVKRARSESAGWEERPATREKSVDVDYWTKVFTEEGIC